MTLGACQFSHSFCSRLLEFLLSVSAKKTLRYRYRPPGMNTPGRELSLPRAAIKSRQTSTRSLMPDGLQAALSLGEFTDLIAYLASLKTNPAPAAPK